MRLINTRTLVLEEYFGDQIPKYAILSHTWRDEEVTYQDWQHSYRKSAKKKGFWKINNACLVARRQSIDYLWVDTNCINKDSSSELSEAINSMFTWHERSSIYFVYLDDFRYEKNSHLADFGTSRWFTRGWTLQELLAPKTVQFFDASWTEFGTKHSLLLEISKFTSIHIQYLIHPDSIRLASVARRMSWAATRSTTREEDLAYCLMGIFEINMPLLYGEGGKAFIRLQEEIIKHSNDHTIFCWSWVPLLKLEETPNWHGCLAPRPISFRDSGDFIPTGSIGYDGPSDFQLTNSGLRISLPLLDSLVDGFKLAMLNARNSKNYDDGASICLYLQKARGESFACSRFPNRLLTIPESWAKGSALIYLAHERDPSRKISTIITQTSIRAFSKHQPYAIFPVSSMHLHRVSLASKFDLGSVLVKYGAAVALRQVDKSNLWSMRMKVHIKEAASIDFKFQAPIEDSESGVWNATIQLVSDDRITTQDISLSDSYGFTLQSPSGLTHVRPVLV